MEQTRRQLRTRIKEHINNIRTPQLSVVLKHRSDYDHSFDWNNAEILDHESNFYKRLVPEMIYIKMQSHDLNLLNDLEMLDFLFRTFKQNETLILKQRSFIFDNFLWKR